MFEQAFKNIDNDPYKALRALREAQAWRPERIEVVRVMGAWRCHRAGETQWVPGCADALD